MTTAPEIPLALGAKIPAIQAPPATAPDAPADLARIAAALRERRQDAAHCLMRAVADWEKYAGQIAAVTNLPEFLWRDYSFMVDYLALRFETGALIYRDLYVGEKVRQAYFEPEAGAPAQIERRRRINEAEARGLAQLLRDRLPAPELAALAEEFAQIARVLTTQAARRLDVLLVGDCLYLDVTAFLTGACLEEGISLNPTLVTTHNPVELRNGLRAMAGRRFDLVFFSPFTYEFSAEYARLQWWHQGAQAPAAIRCLAQAAVDGAARTLDLLGDLFDCPLYVHNSANFRRHDGSLRERIKNLLSWRARRAGRTLVNAALARHVAERNRTTYEHLFVFDEMALLARHGEAALGRLFYDHDSRHPAAMGRYVAQGYRELIAVHGLLARKKLIVCDLDETLWRGVIGEGAVQHYRDRQGILKRLQAKGVVLAIASKNDARNIRWDGALLRAEDFVSTQVNWDSKVVNIKRIAQHLNLKSKDFVFIDDRPDERAMVALAMPEVQVLDATDAASWRRLDLWAQALAGDDATDRTALYREKDARDGFLQQLSAQTEDQGALFAQLGLSVRVRDARPADLKRVVELINRTNQFNTCASRTSLAEASAWLAAGDRRILLVDCSDKFGTMGTISICVVHRRAAALEIPVFVLSCRVFGYGIETVVVNAVKRMALAAGLPVLGRYEASAHNEPCKSVYPDNGFAADGPLWRWSGEGLISDPAWLTVHSA